MVVEVNKRSYDPIIFFELYKNYYPTLKQNDRSWITNILIIAINKLQSFLIYNNPGWKEIDMGL